MQKGVVAKKPSELAKSWQNVGVQRGKTNLNTLVNSVRARPDNG
jgi:hypothetical protein